MDKELANENLQAPSAKGDEEKKVTPLKHSRKLIRLSRRGLLHGIPSSSDSFNIHSVKVVESDGVIEDIEEIELITDATGLVLNPPVVVLDDGKEIRIDIAAISYTGLETPRIHHGICQMCLEENGIITRLYVGKDGFLTLEGNALCDTCRNENDNRTRRINVSWGLWPQTIY